MLALCLYCKQAFVLPICVRSCACGKLKAKDEDMKKVLLSWDVRHYQSAGETEIREIVLFLVFSSMEAEIYSQSIHTG